MTSIANVTIAILAGGHGTRLRPVVHQIPKVIAPMNGVPFLNYVLDSLIAQGGKDALLCIGYGGEQVQACYGDTYRSLNLAYSIEKEPLGTAGALRHCLSKVHSEDVLVSNGDTFCTANLNLFLSWYQKKQTSAAIMLAHKKDVSRFGSVETDAAGRVIQFHEKAGKTGGGYVSTGIYLLHRGIVESIPERKAVSMEYEVLPQLIGNGLWGYKTKSTFIDIGTPQSYRRAQDFFQRHRFPHGRSERAVQRIGQCR